MECLIKFSLHKEYIKFQYPEKAYIIPSYLYAKTLCVKKLRLRFRQFIQTYLWKSDESPAKRALACAVGMGIAFSPFWGFHILLAVFLAWLFRLNKILTIGFSTITIPPIVPLVIAAQVGLGGLIFGGSISVKNSVSNGITLSVLLNTGAHLLIGGVLLALLVGAISYYSVLYLLQKKLSNRQGL